MFGICSATFQIQIGAIQLRSCICMTNIQPFNLSEIADDVGSIILTMQAKRKCLDGKQSSIKKFFSGSFDKTAEKTECKNPPDELGSEPSTITHVNVGESQTAEKSSKTIEPSTTTAVSVSKSQTPEKPTKTTKPSTSTSVSVSKSQTQETSTKTTESRSHKPCPSQTVVNKNLAAESSRDSVQYVVSNSDGEKETRAVFNHVFDGNTGERQIGVHNFYLCNKTCCSSIPPNDHCGNNSDCKLNLKMQHAWLMHRNVGFDKVTGLWWPVFIENTGLYCLLCKKHDTCNPKNKSKVWNISPSVRMRKVTFEDHANTDQHKAAVKTEMLQRISSFHHEVVDKREAQTNVIQKAFKAIYWLAKQEISNDKLASLLNLLESLGLDDIKYFEHRSRPSVREMFLVLGDTIKELIIEKAQQCDGYGLLADEAADISVMEQLLIFIKYFDTEEQTAKTEFLGMRQISSPCGANAENITKELVMTLEECNLMIENLKSFVSDGASVMVGKTNGVAARLRRLNSIMLNFHCVCHKLALACADSNSDIKCIKEFEDTYMCMLMERELKNKKYLAQLNGL